MAGQPTLGNATAPLPALPVPELADTGSRLEQWVSAVADTQQWADWQTAWADFAAHQGATLQQRLQQHADVTEGSWLLEDWHHAYLATRTPLPLSTNVGFVINNPLADAGVAGVAQWLSALVSVCADYALSALPPLLSPRGEPMDMSQWSILAGAARQARVGVDDYVFNPVDHGPRYVGVFWQGFYYRIPAWTHPQAPYGQAWFAEALAHIVAQTQHNDYPVALPSLLGSGVAAPLLAECVREPANAHLLEAINADLLHIGLMDAPDLDADAGLARATFVTHGGVWAYKPLSLVFNLSSGQCVLNSEHTWQDGATLKNIIALARQRFYSDRAHHPDALPAIQPQAWQLSAAHESWWCQAMATYQQQAADYWVKTIAVPIDVAALPPISADALMQWLLQYAQYATWGKVRSTYEAVDVSHFCGGRTECMRPVSVASLTLLAAWRQGRIPKSIWQAAAVEHKNRIKACKLGHGVHRHLLGLSARVQADEMMPAVLTHPAWMQLQYDFLSTSSLGDDAVLGAFAFAPSVPDGVGVNYSAVADGWRFTLSYRQTQADDVDRFAAALVEGGVSMVDVFDVD